MSEKKYYWIKLKPSFFQSKEIKKLRKIAGGDTYVIIYLKMQLLSLENGGKLYFDGIEDNFAEELALSLDEDEENVKMTLAFLEKCDLIEQQTADEYVLPEVSENTGKETAAAIRMRKYRERNNVTLDCNNVTSMLQDRYIDIDIEKEKEKELELESKSGKPQKHKFGEYKHVLLTDNEYKKLCDDYGQSIADKYIQKVDDYCEMKGKSYKNYNLAIRNTFMKSDGVKPVNNKPNIDPLSGGHLDF